MLFQIDAERKLMKGCLCQENKTKKREKFYEKQMIEKQKTCLQLTEKNILERTESNDTFPYGVVSKCRSTHDPTFETNSSKT